MDATKSRLGASLGLRLEIEDFLVREADLVDERKYDEWLAMFADDLHYRMPMVRNVAAPAIAGEYLTGPLDVSWFDEDKSTLATRVAQIRTGVHWAEEPLSRTSHLITNVRILNATPSMDDAQDVEASCKFLINRNRNTKTDETLIGKRIDRLRRVTDSWQVYRRTVLINQAILCAGNLSFFV